MRSPGDRFLRLGAGILSTPESCKDDKSTPDSRRPLDGESAAAVPEFDSCADTLPVEKARESGLLSSVLLLGKDMPGNPSPPLVSILGGLGVGVGSTDTTDLIGKTRSVADGLIWPKGDAEEDDDMGELALCPSSPCRLGLHCLRCVSEPDSLGSRERGSEKDRRCGDDGRGSPAVDESDPSWADPE